MNLNNVYEVIKCYFDDVVYMAFKVQIRIDYHTKVSSLVFWVESLCFHVGRKFLWCKTGRILDVICHPVFSPAPGVLTVLHLVFYLSCTVCCRPPSILPVLQPVFCFAPSVLSFSQSFTCPAPIYLDCPAPIYLDCPAPIYPDCI